MFLCVGFNYLFYMCVPKLPLAELWAECFSSLISLTLIPQQSFQYHSNLHLMIATYASSWALLRIWPSSHIEQPSNNLPSLNYSISSIVTQNTLYHLKHHLSSCTWKHIHYTDLRDMLTDKYITKQSQMLYLSLNTSLHAIFSINIFRFFSTHSSDKCLSQGYNVLILA